MTPFFIQKIQGISRKPLQTIKRIRQLSEFKEVSNSKNNRNINPIQQTISFRPFKQCNNLLFYEFKLLHKNLNFFPRPNRYTVTKNNLKMTS